MPPLCTFVAGAGKQEVIVSQTMELNGFYSRQALRCRLLAIGATGPQAEEINSLADRFDRTAAELKADETAQYA